MLQALQYDGFQRGGGHGLWGRGAPGNRQAEAEWVWEEEDEARGCREHYGCRRRKREAMYVGGGLSVRWGGGVGGSTRQARRRRQAPPAANNMDRAIFWLAPGSDRHLLLCLSTNTQKIKLLDSGLVICHKALRGKKAISPDSLFSTSMGDNASSCLCFHMFPFLCCLPGLNGLI